MSNRVVSPELKAIFKKFGDDLDANKREKPQRRRSVQEKFNYEVVEITPEEIFHKYDVDESGTIDGDELEDVLYDCGVILSDENIEAARRGLGIQKASDSCDLATFKTWWNATHAKRKETRAALMKGMLKEMEEYLIPDLKRLFVEADADSSGALDRLEFENFYPKLREFLGYPIPPVVHCLREIDEDTGFRSDFQNGQIEYEEFEAWFLKMERKRIDKAAESSTGAENPAKTGGGIQGVPYHKLPFMDLVHLCKRRDIKWKFPKPGMNNQERVGYLASVLSQADESGAGATIAQMDEYGTQKIDGAPRA